MKKIKIKICEFGRKDNELSDHFILKILRKYYTVEFSENPEYLFYNESTYDHLKYDCVKIFYTGENICPNFNLCDYAIGFDYMDFGDRYYRLPLYLLTLFYQPKEISQAQNIDFSQRLSMTKSDLKAKTEFCSFVYSNYLADQNRKIFYDKLSSYKKVNSGGSYLNNIGRRVDNKLEFEMKHKFSIAFENSSKDGYTTEKLVNSIMARTIPIYWGNPVIYKEFNENRFINCHKYKNFDDVVNRIIEIDNNDDEYLRIINQPVTIPEYSFEEVLRNFEFFLQNIINQPLNLAGRINIGDIRAKKIKQNELIIANASRKNSRKIKILSKLYRPFKKNPLMQKLKERYFKELI